MTKLQLGIDPGTIESAYVLYDKDSKQPLDFGKIPNEELLDKLYTWGKQGLDADLAIEMIASYGMPVGKTTFETVLWLGRFIEAWTHHKPEVRKIYRKQDTCMHMCHSARAKDANISAAICDRYGGSMKIAKGTKKTPGPLYGFAGDVWQAMGVAITAAETKADEDNLVR
jgi:hypothetical protein